MRKIISTLVAIGLSLMAMAQNYEYPGPFGLPYITINEGIVSPVKTQSFDSFVQNIRPSAGIEIGTYFTPIWGASVEVNALFGTTGSCTIVDQSNLLVNGKVNLSNLLGGYKGYPRRVEVVGVGGLGWGHDYGNIIIDPNYVVYKTGAELNINLGEKRAWQINIRPEILWNNYDNIPTFDYGDMVAHLSFGVTYKFGNKRIKSHNFAINNYSVAKSDYNALLSKYNALKDSAPKTNTVRDTVVVEKVIEKVVEVERWAKAVAPNNIITFTIGSSTLSDTERAKVVALAKGLNGDSFIEIIGSADSETGSEDGNYILARNRADVVRNILIKEFAIKDNHITTTIRLDATDDVLTSRSAILSVSE